MAPFVQHWQTEIRQNRRSAHLKIEGKWDLKIVPRVTFMGKDTSTRSAWLFMLCITERETYRRIPSLYLYVDDANIEYTAGQSWDKC